MQLETFEHPFFHIEIETLDPATDDHLIKILAVDGRRFTYRFRGRLDDDAVNYVKTILDANCFSDMLIERNGTDFSITEARERLKKHS